MADNPKIELIRSLVAVLGGDCSDVQASESAAAITVSFGSGKFFNSAIDANMGCINAVSLPGIAKCNCGQPPK